MYNEAMVESALRRLGADQAEVATIWDRTGRQHLFLPAGHFENLIAFAGLPQTTETIEPSPSDSPPMPLTKLTYQLPLWPELVFCIQGRPDAPIPHNVGFARPPHTLPAVPGSWEDLRPWAWLRDEVIERFGPPIDQGDNWHHEDFKFQIHDAAATSRQFWATFSWNLLQEINPITC